VRLALVVALALLLLVPACGGDGDGGGNGGGNGGGEAAEPEARDPEEWVADVCGAVGSWVADIQEQSTELGETARGAENLEDARDQFAAFFDGVVDRTEEMLTEIEDADAPAVEDGEATAQDLRDTLEPIQGVFENARDEAEDLPTDDPAAFEDGATEIGQTVEEEATEISDAFDELDQRYDVPELDEAFEEEEEACAEL
jgi:hypothetical protein